MIEDYVLCYNSSAEDLVKEIQTYIVKGYQPHGQPFVSHDEIFQALITYKPLRTTDEGRMPLRTGVTNLNSAEQDPNRKMTLADLHHRDEHG